MYDIRQFRPMLYLLILLGFCGFALAAQTPALWMLSVIGLLLNGWLVFTGRFRPLPRLVANAITLVIFAAIALQLSQTPQAKIIIIGQFLVLLQLVKLYEQRGNRDYAQLLVLSLLLMVAAAINTASLLFALIFITYLFLSLYCCLLFHLKAETDTARAAIAVPADVPNPAVLRKDERHLSSSMRRLTALVAVVSLTMAVVVFLIMPRRTGAGMFGQLQYRQQQSLTGFAETVSFQHVARITQNEEIVAWVKLSQDGQPVRRVEPLLLRGLTLSVYNGTGDRVGDLGPWQWGRGWDLNGNELNTQYTQGTWRPDPPLDQSGLLRMDIQLMPSATRVMFAPPGLWSMMVSSRDLRVTYDRYDGSVMSLDAITARLDYSTLSSGDLFTEPLPADVRRITTAPIAREIAEYARQPEVSGRAEDGTPLVELLERTTDPAARQQIIRAIADSIQRHLKTTFTYTLDLTDARELRDGSTMRDPIATFLTRLKRGHCEYFAGAMTLMCQSLGIDARMVIGFKSDDYNQLNGLWVVRQSHAHAWVEVPIDGRWTTYDPTTGRESVREPSGLFSRARQLFDFLEYTWQDNVVAYDNNTRDNLLQSFETTMTNTAIQSSRTMSGWGDWFDAARFYGMSAKLLGAFIGLMLAGVVVAIGWFVWERWRLMRRARRIGLGTLPAPMQMKLVRQLGFYDVLIQMLQRRGIVRPDHLTPREFSQTLTFLPPEAFETINRLTGIYYRVRFGEAELDGSQHSRLLEVVDRLGVLLPPARQP